MDLTISQTQSQNNAKRPVGRPKKPMDIESRVRREIANHRERQRVKTINDGIQALRLLIRCDDINSISKSAVLFRCSDYILSLEKQLMILIEQNILLKVLAMKKTEKNFKK